MYNLKKVKVVVKYYNTPGKVRIVFTLKKRFFKNGENSECFQNGENFEEKFPNLVARLSDMSMSKLIEMWLGVKWLGRGVCEEQFRVNN